MKKHVASLHYAVFEAIMGGMYRFAKEAQAKALIGRVCKQFLLSTDMGDANAPVLWIRGFNVSEDEKTQGFKGHFARLSIQQLENQKYTVIAEKIPVELSKHPEKAHREHTHPNMGHPILKIASKRSVYADITHARDDLMSLHEEFPTVSTPGNDKLFLMVYVGGQNPPIRKMVLKIEAVEGGFVLDVKENVKPQPNKVEKPASERSEDNPSKGRYTAMVALQKRKKGKK